MTAKGSLAENITFEEFKVEILNDYKIAVTSRECSLLGRREVLTGKAKFGIFGGGKELPQIAWAKTFKNGDFRKLFVIVQPSTRLTHPYDCWA